MTWTAGTHGSTYGGNPVSCAAALATIDVIQQEHLLENADKVGDVMLNGLRDMAGAPRQHPRGARAAH